MARKAEQEILTVAGREVAISNPGKVLFPQAGYTKLDVARYYVAMAEGALVGAGDRPNVLVRYPNGIDGEFFYQKRAPESRPGWIDIVALQFPSGRSAEEVVPRDAATLIWMANLACLELHPHPVRADDLDHPDELRIDLDPVPGIEWPQIREVAKVVHAALSDHGLTGWPKTSGSRGMHVYVRIERRWAFDEVRQAALAFAREIERRAPALATSKWWKEERHGVFVDYNQNAKDRTIAAAYSIRPNAEARVSAPLAWDEIDDVDPRDFTLATMAGRVAAVGHRHQGMDRHAGSLDSLLELAARQAGEGMGDAPWPPHYRKQPGEAPRVAPSRRRKPIENPADRLRAEGAPARLAEARPNPTRAEAEAGSHDVTGSPKPARRTSKHPLIEIGRAQKKADALAGVERWKARHPDAAAHLQPADVLVDAMRGRFHTWTRTRINLQHVPQELRPAPEPLDPDENPLDEWKSAIERAAQRPSRTRKRYSR